MYANITVAPKRNYDFKNTVIIYLISFILLNNLKFLEGRNSNISIQSVHFSDHYVARGI
jgi:hypothetical protein